MSSNTQPGATPSSTSGMRQEIAAKWGKFSAQELLTSGTRTTSW